MTPRRRAGRKLVGVALVVFLVSTTGGCYTVSSFVDAESGSAEIRAASGVESVPANTATAPTKGSIDSTGSHVPHTATDSASGSDSPDPTSIGDNTTSTDRTPDTVTPNDSSTTPRSRTVGGRGSSRG